MKKIIIPSIVAVIVSFIPALTAVAATSLAFPGKDASISDVFSWGTAILNTSIALIIGAAVVIFLYGIAQSMRQASNEEARKKGRDLMIYGIVGLAVMFSFWGLVSFVQRSFGFNSTNTGPQFGPVSGTSGTSGSSGSAGSLGNISGSNAGTVSGTDAGGSGAGAGTANGVGGAAAGAGSSGSASDANTLSPDQQFCQDNPDQCINNTNF